MTNSEPFVPIEDLAKHFNVSISTVRAWIRQEHIPKDTYIKICSTYRFRVGDVANALTKTKSERREVPQDVIEGKYHQGGYSESETDCGGVIHEGIDSEDEKHLFADEDY
jgi:uncharacterized protein YjcR